MSILRTNRIFPRDYPGIAINGNPVTPSALVDMQSTTQGFLPPRLTTSQRNAIASPAEGLLIYNTDSLMLEAYDGTQWNNSANALTRVRHFIRVTKDAPAESGDFGSIYDAVNSIALPDPADPWIVWVGPGVYTEPQIDVPPGVHIVGANEESCFVQPDSVNHHIFTLTAGPAPNTPGASLSFLSLQNAGPGTAAIYCDDTGDFLIIHKVTINDCDTGLWFRSNTKNCFSYLEYVDTTGGNTGLKIEANNDFTCYVNAENFYVYAGDPSGVNPNDGVLVTGNGAEFICQASGFEGTTNTSGNAVRANSGVLLDIKAASFRYWAKGLLVENIGDPCDVNITGSNYLHNLQDFYIDQAVVGAIQATANEEDSFFNTSNLSTLALSFIDPMEGNIVTSGAVKRRQPDNTFTDTTTISTDTAALGILVSGDINPPGSPTSFTVTVEAGLGYLHKSDGSLRKISWSDTPIVLSPSSTHYLYFDATATLLSSSTLPNTRENIVIGRVVTHATGIEIIEESGFQSTHMPNALSDALRNGIGVAYSSGSIVAEVGTRNLSVTAGSYYYGELNFLSNGANPTTWVSFYQDGSGGFTRVPAQTVVDNAFWDDGTGTLAAIGAGNYAKHAIYALGDSTNDFDSEAYFLVYSQAQYTALTLAEQGSLPNPPNFLTDGVVLIASVIVQEGFANIVEVRDERPIIGSGRVSNVSASTFHHNLLGLNDFDDHLRYLPVDGSRPMTGDLPMGTHNVTNAGTYNGVTVENHHARHQPGSGLDELPTAAASTLTPDLANAVGTSTSLSRADHIHNVPADVASGLNANSTNTEGTGSSFSRNDHTHAVASGTPSTQIPDQSNAAGTSANFAKADHIHNIPADAPTTTLSPATSNAEGTGTSFARNDHTHAVATSVVGDITTIQPDDSASAGTVDKFARGDHKHAIVADAPTTNLSATTTNAEGSGTSFSRNDHSHAITTGAASTQTPDQANAAGTSASLARADHIHNIATAAPSTTLSPATTNAQGTATSFSRSDHSHAVATSLVGDITTIQPDDTASAGVVDKFARGDHKHAIVASAPTTTLDPTTTNAEGVGTAFARNDHTHAVSTALVADITTIQPDATAAAGTANTYARGDHRHAIVADAPTTNLSATTTNSEGVGTSFSRNDHSHAITTGAVSTQTPDQVNAAGTSASLTRADHVHNIPTAAASTLNANSTNTQGAAATFARSDHTHDLDTGTPSTQNATNTNTEGTSANLARADHLHTITTGTVSTQTPNQSNATGTSASLARADHTHNIPTAAASGLNANSTNTQGSAASFAQSDHTHAIASGAASTQTPDQANATGTSTNFARADHVHNIPTAAASTISSNANAQGSASTFARADHTHELTSGAASLDSVPQYDNTNWQAINPEQLLNPSNAVEEMEDFFTTGGKLDWTTNTAGGGSTVAVNSAKIDTNHLGVLKITSGNAGGNYANLNLTPILALGGGSLTLTTLIQVETLATITNDYVIRVGLADTTASAADAVNGVYFEYNRSTSANWLIKTANASTRTSTTTSTAVLAGSWVKLAITVNAAASSISYSINGSSVGTITTNIPTAVLGLIFQQARSAGTPVGFDVDFVKIYQRFTSSR